MKAGKKVFVGMSGGVDSSVSAALLKEQGYDVTGVFIKVWQPEGFACTWKEDRLDAMRVAAGLDIPFLTLDLESEYKQGVIDYMLDEYEKGRTPNPDVMCNKTVKFGAFLDWALKRGADYIATGHYARVHEIKDERLQMHVHQLVAGADESKDQSYFLWTLSQDQLAHTIFPIGAFPKKEVRQMAEDRGLYTAQKKDSQGLCFVGKLDMREFLKEFIDVTDGDVLDEEGKVIGRHDGALLYTTGQRHGFTVTNARTDTAPLYVVARDVPHNTITVGPKKQDRLAGEVLHVTLSDVVWHKGEVETPVYARVRYRQELQRGVYTPTTRTLQFDSPQLVAAGQSAVLYDGACVLGGGIIE
jgi:tRNA-specific 2-thiouridylase